MSWTKSYKDQYVSMWVPVPPHLLGNLIKFLILCIWIVSGVPQLQPMLVWMTFCYFWLTRRWGVFVEWVPYTCDPSSAFCLSYSHSPCSGLSDLWKRTLFMLVGKWQGRCEVGNPTGWIVLSFLFVLCFLENKEIHLCFSLLSPRCLILHSSSNKPEIY